MKKVLPFLLFFFPLFSSRVSANVGLSLNPPVTEILLAPNHALTHTIRLTNAGDDIRYTLSLHRLIPTDDQGHSTLDPRPLDPSSIPLLLTLEGQSWDTPTLLKQGATTYLNLRLSGSNVDTPTDVYLGLLIRPLPLDPLSQSSTSTPALTSLLLVTLTPDSALPVNLTLDDPALPSVVDTALPFSPRFRTTNQTDTMLRFTGKLTLTSPRGQLLHSRSLDPTLVLGQTSRALPAFTYTPKLTDLGPHNLTLTLTTEGGRELATHSYVIWFLPLRAALLSFVIILALTILKIRAIRLTKGAEKA